MADEINYNVYYLCNPDVVLREEDESGALLFKPDTNQVKVINTTGAFIWKQLDGKNNVETIIANLMQAYTAEREEIEQDVLGLVAELAKRKMVVEIAGL